MNSLSKNSKVNPLLATGICGLMMAVAMASLNMCIFVLVDEVKTPVATLQRYKAENDII